MNPTSTNIESCVMYRKNNVAKSQVHAVVNMKKHKFENNKSIP